MSTTAERKRAFRKRQYKRQKGLCWICGEKMAISQAAAGTPAYATLDHVVPRAQGGVNAKTNLRLAHTSCNFQRGDLPEALVLMARSCVL